jgi:choice-of-anchor C domain-containing protein
MKRTQLFLIAIALFVSLIMAVPVHANIIYNGSFEEGGSGVGAGNVSGSTIPGWTVVRGNVDWSYDSDKWWDAADGHYSLDMDGSTPASIKSRAFDTIAGQSYKVTFAMAGNPWGPNAVKTMDVSVSNGPTYSFSYTNTETPINNSFVYLNWTDNSFTFTASSSSTDLTFISTTTNPSYNQWYGAALDNVRVDAVPLPSALLLFAPGLAGLAAIRRRFRK